jgi:DNA-binding XRE family transcriptional regulator
MLHYTKDGTHTRGERVQTAPDIDRVLNKMKPGTVMLPGLRRIREERGLSIRELAREAGVAPDTVWRLENLQRAAEPKSRRNLAKALGVRIRDLRRTEEADER